MNEMGIPFFLELEMSRLPANFRAMQKLFILLVLGFWAFPASAQYHLGEIGLMAGAGGNIPFGSPRVKPSFGVNGDFFYSHWVCGKRYGYHISAGLRAADVSLTRDFVLNFPLQIGTPSRFTFTYFDAGFYFKIRLHEFHRPQEIAFLVGPKLNVTLAANASSQSGAIKNDNFKTVFPVNTGIHASVWIKRKLGKQSFFIQPGLEYYFLPNYKSSLDSFTGLYPFVNLGLTLWNSKTQFKFRKRGGG